MQNNELSKFYVNVREEINSILISDEEGTNPEQIFTDIALSYLVDSGETENYRVCFSEKISKRGIEHKINGYALYENYETLDLFITLYNSDDEIVNIKKSEVDKGLDRATKFFRNAAYGDYINEIEESSEIYDLANTLANVKEVKEFLTRVNIVFITNGQIKSEVNQSEKIAGYQVYYRAVDINYLYNLSDKSRIPIEINFKELGYKIPCIANPVENEDYQSWLAIIPGQALAEIYEQFGPRLLEQNVRSFLQFTGKINKGIRRTIQEEQHMFMAFNNGIAATADELIIEKTGGGLSIASVSDFQIVNGGQTTASIFHTWKKDKIDIRNVQVPVKLTIVKDKENFGEVVGRIAEYANTQNRVSASDLSSNRENHVLLEKLSRTIWASPKEGETHQTRWFFERSRGQYRNERTRHGVTPARKKQFDKQNPRSQMFTKELLAKYVNTYQEKYSGKRIVIGPHIVVRGSQKNYAQFLNHNFKYKPNTLWFEDMISLAILFKSCEKTYGVKPNAIGDMRYITVPYSIGWLGYKLDYKLSLLKIWKNQSLSIELTRVLEDIMRFIENFIKENAPGSLYGEWAKKEECWTAIKEESFNLNLSNLKEELQSIEEIERDKQSDAELEGLQIKASLDRLNSIHHKIWKKIELWGKETGKLSTYQVDMSNTISNRVRLKRQISQIERKQGEIILDFMAETAPEIFYDLEEYLKQDDEKANIKIEVSVDRINALIKWDRQHKRLKSYEFSLMYDISQGNKLLTDRNKRLAEMNIKKAQKYGFRK